MELAVPVASASRVVWVVSAELVVPAVWVASVELADPAAWVVSAELAGQAVWVASAARVVSAVSIVRHSGRLEEARALPARNVLVARSVT